MVLYENGLRIGARAVTFIGDSVLFIERHRLDNGEWLHYFTIPGGGVEIGEDFSDTAIRETMEETCCKIEIIETLEVEDYPGGKCHWFFGKYISGTPELGGEEKERNKPENSFKVVLIDMKDIDKVNILGHGKRIIKECYEKYKAS